MKQKTLYKPLSFSRDKEILKLFSAAFFSAGEVDFSGRIIVAVIKFDKKQLLAEQWKQVNSFITAQLIAGMDNEFSKWNFYVFYLCGNPVDKQLKYEIENNKFSSRKVVLEDFQKQPTTEDINEIVNENITNENILIPVPEKIVPVFKKNPLFSDIIDKTNLAKANKDKDEILSKALDQIEKKFRK